MFTRLTNTTWTTKVVLVVVAVALLVPLLASAQPTGFDTTEDFEDSLGGSNSGGTGQTPANGYVPTDPQGQPGGVTFQDNAGNDVTTGAPTSGTVDPANPEPTNLYGESALKALLYTLVVNLFGTLVGWAGILLDFGINKFVIGFGTAFNTQGVGQAVDQLWSLVRDFFNILFIFGFIWIGFQMILDSSSGAKKTLITLIMAALLVNFSLFISKFVVDFSNRLASEIAQAAFPLTGGAVGNVGSSAQEVAVADTFFAHMGVPQTIDLGDNIRDGSNAPWAFIFGSAIFYLVAAFVFAAGGIMLIIRFVALSIFMVLSPFMFLGWVFPGMQGWTSKYWKGFLGRAFYAPVYIVLLFFAGTILQNFFGNRGSMQNDFVLGGGTDNGFYGAAALGEILPAFILSCAFLIAAVQVAGKMSADGASGVMKVGNSLRSGGRRAVGGATFGIGARVGRNTIGRGADAALNNEKFKSYASRSAIGRQLYKGTQATAGASFDARQVGKVGKNLGIGEGKKGGFAKEAKDRAKAEDKFAKDIAASVDFNDPKTQFDLQQRAQIVRSQKQGEIDKLQVKREKEKLERQKDPKWQKKQMDIGEKMDDIEHNIEQNGGVATIQQRAELEQLKFELEKDEFIIKQEIANLEKERDDSLKIAKGEMKFGNEIEYAKQLKRSEKFWKTVGTVAGSAGVGVAAGAGALAFSATAPLSIPIGLAAALASKVGSPGNAQLTKAGYKEIEKRVGKDGTKGLKNDQSSKAAKAIKQLLDEQSSDDTKKDDNKDKEGDS